MLLTRRSILGGLAALIAAPAIVRAESLMPLQGVKLRQRLTWAPKLESDGSVSIVKGQTYYLDEWLKTQVPADWGESSVIVQRATKEVLYTLQTPSLVEVATRIETDKTTLAERVGHWEDFTQFQHMHGVKVDAFISEPGERLRNDPPIKEYKKIFDSPVFQYFRKDEALVCPF